MRGAIFPSPNTPSWRGDRLISLSKQDKRRQKTPYILPVFEGLKHSWRVSEGSECE